MQVSTLFGQGKPTFSFEFFPPKSEAASDTLFRTIQDLTCACLCEYHLRRRRVDP